MLLLIQTHSICEHNRNDILPRDPNEIVKILKFLILNIGIFDNSISFQKSFIGESISLTKVFYLPSNRVKPGSLGRGVTPLSAGGHTLNERKEDKIEN